MFRRPRRILELCDARKMQHRPSKNTEERERRIARRRSFGALALVFQCLEEWAWVCRLTGMTKYLTTYATVLTLSLSTLSLCPAWAQSTPSQDRQDNTRINQRDRNPGEATADQQKANPADRDLTSKIRKAIVDDKSLSTYAHNVKVISQNGTVTLKGPVRSDAEMKSILAKAQDMAGADKVVNEMSVQPENVSK
jgi:hypothetical protein